MQGKLGRDVYCLLGLPFDATNMAGAVQRVRDAVADRARCFISTPNLNWLVNCRKDPQFRDSVLMSDLSVADGMPLIWIAWFLGIPISERVAGAGLFEQLKNSAVNYTATGVICEQVVSYMNNSEVPLYNETNAADWISFSSLSPGTSLLSTAELKELSPIDTSALQVRR